MGLAENILANEKVMDKLAQIYANALSGYYGNGKRGTDREAKNDMIYFLEQNCGVCQTPSAISAQLAKIWETYYIGGNPCPVMEDWHNLLEW